MTIHSAFVGSLLVASGSRYVPVGTWLVAGEPNGSSRDDTHLEISKATYGLTDYGRYLRRNKGD